ncbi:hypothetical protein RZR97_05180 [Hydrogenimonas thermophila]|uniref:hypothetical protein n=1 Tax=Hydrogenimonas thermophila TaxID=223786 RepID=UPI002937060E|nr:hypothetical protein [Hydrogenimonas thermophila]WOE70967.1 hypothetical protein RZR91_05200 [Hydrogenimonas thermophila]WOE73485.1 hypothetical protein RZR97_05180 [Hydrogenimonas thermophila]
MRLLFILIIFAISLFSDDKYIFGEGWKPTEKPIYLGGYLSAVADLRNDKQIILVDELAFMVYGEYNRFGFMSEFEIEDFYSKTFDETEDETFSQKVHIERLNVNYFIDDNSEIMIGKFFSEIGFWNTWPINVLRDTTSDPHILETIFPEMSTGILYKRFFKNLTIYLTFQNNRGIDDTYNNFNIDYHYALALSFENGENEWRIGGGQFSETDGDSSLYVTLGYCKDLPSWTFMIESGIRKSDKSKKIFYDVYGQSVWHILPKHDLILRIESYRDLSEIPKSNSIVFGYTYRPLPYIALKGEVDFFDNGSERSLFSFSMMF